MDTNLRGWTLKISALRKVAYRIVINELAGSWTLVSGKWIFTLWTLVSDTAEPEVTMSNEMDVLKARIESLERRVRELEGLVILAQRHETLMGMAIEGLRREMNGCAETVNGMDAMVKEHDINLYLLMTRADRPVNREQKQSASKDEFDFDRK